MDSKTHWRGIYYRIPAVLRAWNERRIEGIQDNRMGEVHAISILALALTAHNKKEYRIGFPRLGHEDEVHRIDALFDSRIAIDEDFDLLLCPAVRAHQEEKLRHPVQITRFTRQSRMGTEPLLDFLRSKKLDVQPDERLILLVHLEQAGRVDYRAVHEGLREADCPYGQVFLVGQYAPESHHRWFCTIVYPEARKLKDLDFGFLDSPEDI